MKNISHLLHQIVERKQKKCSSYQEKICQRQGGCVCRRLAEIEAYCTAVIPEQFTGKTIQDFDGMVDGKQVLPPMLLAKAKEAIMKYCWKGIEEGSDYEANVWITKSVIPKRLAEGTNLIIYGDPLFHDRSSGQFRTITRQIGRTLAAAIVIREAIFQRIKAEHSCDTYEWVDYTTLTKRLMAQAHGNKDHDAAIADYEEADWLVVDGLMRETSEGKREFKASVLDKLFCERLDSGLPSVLVFQDDIRKFDSLQYEFGTQINSIVNSRKTMRIAIVEDENG